MSCWTCPESAAAVLCGGYSRHGGMMFPWGAETGGIDGLRLTRSGVRILGMNLGFCAASL